MFVIDNDLFKAGSHKYIKRTGAPGSYKYWYKDPSGRLVAHADDAHEGAKTEHLKRLIAGRMREAHSMTDAEMAAHTGLDRTKVGQHVRNMRRPANTSAQSYSENELHEAKHSDVGSDEYNRKVEGISGEAESAGTPARATAGRASRPAARTRGARPAATAAAAPETSRPASEPSAPAASAASSSPGEGTTGLSSSLIVVARAIMVALR